MADINPMRPHALRAAFSSILSLNGMNQKLVDYLQGHADQYGGAYYKISDEEIREKYEEHSKALALDYREDFDKLESRVNDKIQKLENMNEAYETRVMELKEEVRELKELERNRINALAKEEPDIPEDMKRKLIKLIESEMSKK